MKMQVVRDPTALRKEQHPVVLAAGFFDGMHRGHKKVVETAIARAAALDGKAWVLTFDRHPLRVLNPAKAPPLLMPVEQKLKVLEEMRVHGCILLPFTRQLSAMEAGEFAEYLVSSIPSLREIVVGENWRFGKGRSGKPTTLAGLNHKGRMKTTVVRPVIRSGTPVSSTRIRRHVLEGNIEEANAMLGRPFSILGKVIRGRQVAHRMGFPTANLETEAEVLPPFGVYAVVAFVMGHMKNGILNYGLRPTFTRGQKASPILEVHLFDFQGDLYGKELDVFLVERIRDERMFPDEQSLRTQVELDIRLARAVLGSHQKNKS